MSERAYVLQFLPGWDVHFQKMDSSVRRQILKKFEQMKRAQKPRRLHQSPYLVEEIGQYRIGYILDETAGAKKIHFVGNHKQYEKWYKSFTL